MISPGILLTSFGTTLWVDSQLQDLFCPSVHSLPNFPPISSTMHCAPTQGTPSSSGPMTSGTSLWRPPRHLDMPPTLSPRGELRVSHEVRSHGKGSTIPQPSAPNGPRNGPGPASGTVPSLLCSHSRSLATPLAGQGQLLSSSPPPWLRVPVEALLVWLRLDRPLGLAPFTSRTLTPSAWTPSRPTYPSGQAPRGSQAMIAIESTGTRVMGPVCRSLAHHASLTVG